MRTNTVFYGEKAPTLAILSMAKSGQKSAVTIDEAMALDH